MKDDENRIESDTEQLRPPAVNRHVVTVLSAIYLDAGLPLEAAVRSAVADYQCSFDDERIADS